MQKDIKSIINVIKTREIFDITGTAVLNNFEPTIVTMDELPPYTGDLVGRILIISGSLFLNDQSVTILSVDGLKLTTTGEFEFGEPVLDEELNELLAEDFVSVVIEKDVDFEAELNNLISTLNTSNPFILTSFDIPSRNDYFLKYEKLSEMFIQQLDSYKLISRVNSFIRDINEFIYIDTLSLNRTQLQTYATNLNSVITIIDTEQSNILAYFERVKKLLIKFKITDLKIADEAHIDLYDTRSDEDKLSIDSYYTYYENTSYDAYIDNKQVLLHEIKID